jgi:DNA polymerase III subunit delta'
VIKIQGHDDAIATFRAAMNSDRLHHAWLLTGPEGLGKGTLARQFALRLLAEAFDPSIGNEGISVAPENKIANFFNAFTHPDYKLLERLPKDEKLRDKPRSDWPEGYERARSINVDQVRTLTASFATTPSLSQRRVVIIDAADDMERSAANALLKALEEPPKGTIFLLVNHVPDRILPTIRSRCRMLRFKPLPVEAVSSILRSHLPDIDPQDMAAAARASDGAPGKALDIAGLGLGEIDEVLNAIVHNQTNQHAARQALGQKLALKASQSRYEFFLGRVPAFIADMAKRMTGPALGQALDQYQIARKLSQSAIQSSLDPQAVVFALTGCVAALAPFKENVKA